MTYTELYNTAITAKDKVQEILNNIYDEVAVDANLTDLNSTSATAVWRLWCRIFAFLQYALITQWERYNAVLQASAKATIAHTAAWYAARSLEFQYGDSLVATNGPVQYAVIDESKQIVKAAAVVETIDGILVIKIAKMSGGSLTALSPTEQTAFEGYIRDIRDAGVLVQVISLNADVLKFSVDIYYDSIRPLPLITADVETAITTYLLNIPFDGIFRISKLVDAIQSVTSVVDVNMRTCDAAPAYSGGGGLYQPVNVFYETLAGYIVVDPMYSLTSMLNFVPRV